MRRLLGLPLLLSTLLSSLACHIGKPPRPPADPAAELDALIARIEGLGDDPRSGACEELDAALANLADSEVGRLATYARAEAALRCDRPGRWQALHEQLARADYLPSLMRLANDALEQRDWDRALLIVERLGECSETLSERERMQQVEAQIIHARWVDRGDPDDFARLERAAKREIVRHPDQLEPRAALIRLYVEQAGIAGDRGALILAQITEREARRIAGEVGLQSPALELVTGFIRELEDDRLAAVAAWTAALQLNAALVEPHLWLGLAALERHDPAAAQVHLRAFTQVHPNHVDALLALGVAARRLDEVEEARRIDSRILELAPDDPRIYWHLALLDDPERLPDQGYRDEVSELLDFQRSLRVVTASCERSGPRSCPDRGRAGPDRGCLREAEALARSCELAGELAAVTGELIAMIPPIVCTLGSSKALEERLREEERERRERLLELERRALELPLTPR
ncbi:MAG: tetratricopeptide repeat protein [Enhygromyxa sp.]